MGALLLHYYTCSIEAGSLFGIVRFHACFPYFTFYNFEVLFVFFTSQVRQLFVAKGVSVLLLNH